MDVSEAKKKKKSTGRMKKPRSRASLTVAGVAQNWRETCRLYKLFFLQKEKKGAFLPSSMTRNEINCLRSRCRNIRYNSALDRLYYLSSDEGMWILPWVDFYYFLDSMAFFLTSSFVGLAIKTSTK